MRNSHRTLFSIGSSVWVIRLLSSWPKWRTSGERGRVGAQGFGVEGDMTVVHKQKK